MLLLMAFAGCRSDERTPLPDARSVSAAPAPEASPPIDRTTPLPSPLPAVAARVNGQSVLTRNVRISAEQALARGVVTPEERAFAYRQAAQNLVDRELLFQEATRRGLAPDAKALEEAANQARVGYKDDEAWRAFLAQQGMDEQAFRTELRVQHTVQALMLEVARGVPDQIPEADQRAFYGANPQLFESGERFRASHILLRVPQGATLARKAQVRALAEGVLEKIRKGEDFASVARSYSQDADSAKAGGLLPPFSRAQMVPALAEAAAALQPEQVSGLVETPFGFQILKLHERLPSQKTSFEQARPQLKQHLLAEKRQQALQALVRSLRAQAQVETFL